ncbi:sigma-70 family RNA polymerase sigma factor [Ferruginibacter paludis]|uniref:RNA polymerase sigma factor n=1 Tax=Ferruginibacter paludis TaxID=1310417 RepID=UPI0025B5123F|nr:sigma-70 family RNA polymerase sigma factor [Ferruginibacter paludis]MDN3655106.1 sigma-70 family RNA polymerase sigma factor [Ferruginibacter paludis]
MTFITNISADQQSDKELLAAFKTHDNIKYLSILYQRYMDLVFGVCLKYFKDAERSKDAVMDIFEELNTKLKLHEVDNFKGWLYVLARNYCLMQLRSPRNLKTSEWNADFMQSAEVTHLQNEAFEKETSFKHLEACMETLPADQKQSIELFYLQKKSYNEISVITGFEWNKVRSFIQNGKRNLKLCVEAKQADD